MELITTYPAAVNSKATVTMGVLDQATTIVEVLDATVLPEAPNLLVLGTDQTAETVLMTAKENNTLTIQRAVQGIAKSWPAGTQIARNFTGKDWDDMRSNVEALFNELVTLIVDGVVPIDKGGTGATNRTDALGSLAAVGTMINTANYSYLGEITTNGVYQVSTTHPDNPQNSSNYGILLVFQINGYTQQFYQSINDTDSRRFYVRTSGDGGSTWGDWINLADASKFLPLTGGTLSGNLTINKGVNWNQIYINTEDANMRSSIHVGNSSDSSFMDFQLSNDYDNSSWSRELLIFRSYINGNPPLLHILNTKTGKEYNIFGEHNKPSGSYTGNGSATRRTIETGGIGKVLAIYSANGSAIVTPHGAIFFYSSTVTSLGSSSIAFKNGVLSLATSNTIVNQNGIVYGYQVL